MIKNERQNRIIRSQAEEFQQAIQQLEQDGHEDPSTHPLLQQAQRDAMRSQLADLKDQVFDYWNRARP